MVYTLRRNDYTASFNGPTITFTLTISPTGTPHLCSEGHHVPNVHVPYSTVSRDRPCSWTPLETAPSLTTVSICSVHLLPRLWVLPSLLESKCMTLLPCTSPYSFGLVVSSSLLGGDLVNGVFSESGEISFPIGLSRPGHVTITVVQQEFGVTTAVSLCSLDLHTQV